MSIKHSLSQSLKGSFNSVSHKKLLTIISSGVSCCIMQETTTFYGLSVSYANSVHYCLYRLRSFQMPDWPVASANVDSTTESAESSFSYSPPSIVEMYQVTSAVLPVMNGKR